MSEDDKQSRMSEEKKCSNRTTAWLSAVPLLASYSVFSLPSMSPVVTPTDWYPPPPPPRPKYSQGHSHNHQSRHCQINAQTFTFDIPSGFLWFHTIHTVSHAFVNGLLNDDHHNLTTQGIQLVTARKKCG